MAFGVDKNYTLLLNNITAGVTASGLPLMGDARLFTVALFPTLTGAPSSLTAVIDGSNDGVNWFEASTVSGIDIKGTPQVLQVTGGSQSENSREGSGGSQFRLKITCAGSGGANVVAGVCSKRNQGSDPVYGIDKKYSFTVSDVAEATVFTDLSGAGDFAGANAVGNIPALLQVIPTITGSPTFAVAVIEGSNDGLNWTKASSGTQASGTLLPGTPVVLTPSIRGMADYRFKVSCIGPGGVSCTAHYVTKRNL